jgi:hypothetical protein
LLWAKRAPDCLEIWWFCVNEPAHVFRKKFGVVNGLFRHPVNENDVSERECEGPQVFCRKGGRRVLTAKYAKYAKIRMLGAGPILRTRRRSDALARQAMTTRLRLTSAVARKLWRDKSARQGTQGSTTESFGQNGPNGRNLSPHEAGSGFLWCGTRLRFWQMFSLYFPKTIITDKIDVLR